MLRDALRMWTHDRLTLLREAFGLAGLAVGIVAALYLPILA